MTPSTSESIASRRSLAILGPTASGKSDLAMEIARRVAVSSACVSVPAARCEGSVASVEGSAVPSALPREGLSAPVEIVSIDSMQVYKNMDIGTSTPTECDRAEVPHHMVNLLEPSEEFTIAQFQREALKAIQSILVRGRVPLLVGGTGLYLRAIVDNLDIPGRYQHVRDELDAEMDTAVLYRRLGVLDPVAASRMEPTNRRRVIRALEVTIGSGRAFSSYGPGLNSYPDTKCVMIGLLWPQKMLDKRIENRLTQQINAGFLDEVKALAAKPISRTAAQAIGYKDLFSYLRDDVSLEETIQNILLRTRQFARRQMRWFRRDPRIVWLEAPVDVSSVLDVWFDKSGCVVQ